jgi:carbohydrate diacid regulator
MLSPVLAQQIARETTEAVGHNVIITDDEAVVIGSGDEMRVGSLHEASLEVMQTQESAWHTPAQARRLQGVRPGMTLPLVIDGAAVGTVGITGSPDQVRQFGLLVRRQTEILLEESALVRSRLLRERVLEDLLGEVVDYTTEGSDPDLLEATAQDLACTLQVHRQALLIRTDATIGPEFLRAVRAVFHHRHDLVARRTTTSCLVLMYDDERSPAEESSHLIAALEERFECRVRVGLGEVAATLTELAASCADAADAVTLATRVSPTATVTQVGEVRAHQALAALPPASRHRLIDGTLGSLPSRPDWPSLRATVMAWCESGCNLVAAAATLNIHRNTLLYRLDKLEQLLGRSWRDHRGMLATYVACLADADGRPPVP